MATVTIARQYGIDVDLEPEDVVAESVAEAYARGIRTPQNETAASPVDREVDWTVAGEVENTEARETRANTYFIQTQGLTIGRKRSANAAARNNYISMLQVHMSLRVAGIS